MDQTSYLGAKMEPARLGSRLSVPNLVSSKFKEYDEFPCHTDIIHRDVVLMYTH